MHDDRDALIPFYLNRTLPPDVAAAFQQHLAECATCRQALDEWRGIAAATYQAADEWSQALPSLAPQVRAPIPRALPMPPPTVGYPPNVRVLPPPRRPSYRRTLNPLAATIAAVLVLVVVGMFFVGASALLRRDLPDPAASQIAILTTATPTPAAPSETNPFLDLRSRTPTPTVTLTPSDFAPIPSATFAAPTRDVQAAASVTLTAIIEAATPEVASLNATGMDQGSGIKQPMACYATSSRADYPGLLAGPGVNYDVIGTLNPGVTLRVLVYTPDGWYQVIPQAGGRPAWVYGGAVTLEGDCDRLLQPPSVPTPDGSCVATGSGTVNIYAGPGTDYPVLNALLLADRPLVGMQSDDGWFQLQQMSYGSLWIGWAQGVAVEGNCASLPYVAQADFVPEPLPVLNQPVNDEPGANITRFTTASDVSQPGEVVTLSWEVSGAAKTALTVDLNLDGIEDARLDPLYTTGRFEYRLPPLDSQQIGFTLHAFNAGNFSTTPDVTSTIMVRIICPPVYLLFEEDCRVSNTFPVRFETLADRTVLLREDTGQSLTLYADGQVVTGESVAPVTNPPPGTYILTVERGLFDPVQPQQVYRLSLPDGRRIQLEQITGGDFTGWRLIE